MSKKEVLIGEIENLPDTLVDEILDFVRFLVSKSGGEVHESTMLSESSLRKDWLTEEEDKAWQDL